MHYIRFKIPLHEANFFQKLAILANTLVMSTRAVPTTEPRMPPPAFTIAQAAGEYGKTNYKSRDIEDIRKSNFNVLKPLRNEDLLWPKFTEEEKALIDTYNLLAGDFTPATLTKQDGEFLYRLRTATIHKDYKLFYKLISDRVDELMKTNP